MFKILFLETATNICKLGIINGEKNIILAQAANKIIDTLPLIIDQGLDKIGLTFNQIDYIVCGTGPGVYTNLLFSLSYINGMSLANSIQVLSTPSPNFYIESNAKNNKWNWEAGGVKCTIHINKNDISLHNEYDDTCSTIDHTVDFKINQLNALFIKLYQEQAIHTPIILNNTI